MDTATIKLLDELDAGDTIEVDHLVGEELRTAFGVYEGIEVDGAGDWVLQRVNHRDIKLIDVRAVRKLSFAS